MSELESPHLRSNADTCLSFTIEGDWGHFRRVEGNIVKQTYRIPPRTTVAGLIAGMLGFDRNTYYSLFSDESSAIAIEPQSRLRTMNMPVNTLSTDPDNMTSVGHHRSIKLGLVTADDPVNRQQHNYEVLVSPSYRIDVWIEDTEAYQQLREFLETGKSIYPPSLGLSEYIANIEYHGEFEIGVDGSEGVTEVASSVPNAPNSVIPSPDTKTAFEKSPGFMESTEHGRQTTGFIEHGFSPTGDTLQVNGIETQVVDGRGVVFA